MSVRLAGEELYPASKMSLHETKSEVFITYSKMLQSGNENSFTKVIHKKGTSSRTSERPFPIEVPILGIYGMIEVNERRYIIYIKRTRILGNFGGEEVHEIKGVGCLQLSAVFDKTEFLKVNNLINDFFRLPGLLFSKESLFKAGISKRISKEEQSEVQSNTDFMFNYLPSKKFLELHPDCAEFMVEVIQGFYGTTDFSVHTPERTHSVSYTLLSRRSWKNAGTRFHTRGADQNGHAANTVETVYFMKIKNSNHEFMQIRGSIPLKWKQKINLSYKPPVTFGSVHQIRKAFEEHMKLLKGRYGRKIAVINLLDELGHEADLNFLFKSELLRRNVPSVSMDYHRMLKGGQREKEALINSIKDFLNDEDFIIRTNCVDCLDRTNVIQFSISKMKMYEQITGNTRTGQEVTALMDESDVIKLANLWNENGNTLSLQYAGSNALKCDVAKYGFRTMGGIIKDMISSGRRYLANNFVDGRMQDAVEVATGTKRVLGNSGRGNGFLLLTIFLFLVSYAFFANLYLKKDLEEIHLKKVIPLFLLTQFLILFVIIYFFSPLFLSFPSKLI